ncbi:MAG: CoA transferase [Minwuiales bacterium]|nr:CoA transferase [Minwuiales bacterium]
MTSEQPVGALAGLTVVDLTQTLAGPYCTMLLADQGARVIKIEPVGGDWLRRLGPFLPDDEAREHSGYFHSINRNKLGIALDLKAPEGQRIVRELAKDADVLVENFRAGVMERLGLAYESLREINPRLVYAAVRGFGDPRTGESPYQEWPAYDVVAQAMGGLMGITGPSPEQPLKAGPGVGDIVPAMLTAVGILSAVHHAGRTGQGQFVDVAMYDGVLALCERIVYQQTFTGETPEPQGNRHPLFCPFGLFPASDGWISIACAADEFWRALAAAMGRPELGNDPRYRTSGDRIRNSDDVIAMVEAWSKRHSKAELKEILGGKVPFGPVQDAAEIVADPHVRARNMLADPGICRGSPRIANTPIHMTETPGGVRRAAPTLGQDTDQVLGELGYSAENIESLRRAGVVS